MIKKLIVTVTKKFIIVGICWCGLNLAYADIFSSIPADTTYFYGNSKPAPASLIEYRLRLLGKIDNKLLDKLFPHEADGSFLSFNNALVKNIYSDLDQKGALEKKGLSKNFRQVFYELDLFPVWRIEITDPAKIKKLIAQAEQESEYKLEWKKCHSFDCIVFAPEKVKIKFAFVLKQSEIAMAVFTPDLEEKYLNHLTGKTHPASNINNSGVLSAFIKSNAYTGYGEGFINLKGLLPKIKTVINTIINKTNKVPANKNKYFNNCMEFAGRVIDHIPEIIFGITEVAGEDKTRIKMESVLKTSETAGSYLKSLTDTESKVSRIQNPVSDFGLNLDTLKLQDALLDFVAFIKKNGSDTKCITHPEQLDEFNVFIAKAMESGLDKLRGIYLGLADISLKEDAEQMSDFSALVSVYALNAPSLVKSLMAMTKMPTDKFDLTADGKMKAFPPGIVPPVVSELKYRITDKKIDFFVKNGVAKDIIFMPDDKSPALWHFSFAVSTYFELMQAITKNLGRADDELEELIEFLNGIKVLMPASYLVKIRPDDRGLVVDHEMELE